MLDKLNNKILNSSALSFTIKRRGNVLLLALLLLAGGIVGGLTVAVLVISELRQASSIDNALVAYTDAESGLEQTLYDVRQTSNCPGGGCSGGITYISCLYSAQCEININPSSQVVIPLLKKDETFQLDFEPNVDNIDNLEVYWSEASDLIDSFLEITFINKTASGFEVKKPHSGLPYACIFVNPAGVCLDNDQGSPVSFSTAGSFLSKTHTYQVRFKALNNHIVNLRIVPDQNKKFSHYLDVKSRSQKKNVRQVLQTNIPSQLPIYGFADYVLFTEQAIVK